MTEAKPEVSGLETTKEQRQMWARAARALLSRLKGEGQVSPSHVETAETEIWRGTVLGATLTEHGMQIHCEGLISISIPARYALFALPDSSDFDQPTERDNAR